MDFLVLILTSIIFLFFLHGLDHYRRRRLPPGPIGYPVIGNLLDLGAKPHESLAKLAKKHGPFMTIKLGTITTLVASTRDVAREILQRSDDVCSGRIMPDVITVLDHPEAGVLWMPPDDTWRAVRKAFNVLLNQKKLNSLRDIREKVMSEALEFLRESGRKKTAVDFGKLIFSVSLNQIANTFISENVAEYGDLGSVGKFKMALDTVIQTHETFNIADIFPVLKPFDPQRLRRKMKVAHHLFDEVIDGYITERLKRRELKMPATGDMMDSLIDFSQEQDQQKFSLIHVKSLIVDSFLAGADTSSRTTTWTMINLLFNPTVFLKVRKEVSQIVGEDGEVNESKLFDLPYLQAVIKETMRLHLAIPLLAPHKTLKELKLGDYIIPKNTQILVNAWAMARDSNYWEDPEKFMPERFLGSKVDFKGQHFEFIPFGSGRRMCPGTPLAQRMVSLMVASFVYHFDWKLPQKTEMDSLIKFTTPFIATPVPLK